MAINQISTSNTFQQWLVSTQILIEKYNYYENEINLVYDTANSVYSTYSNTVNVYSNTTYVYSNTVNVFLDTVNVYSNTVAVYNDSVNVTNELIYDTWNVANQIYEISNNVSDLANTASNTSNLALSTANQAFDVANVVFSNAYYIIQESVSSNNFYITFTNNTNGLMREIIIDTSKLYYNPSNGQLNATNFNSLSDANKKTEVMTLENAINQIMELRGVSFRWKENGQKSIGVLAQEVEKIIPEIVSTNQYGEKSVSYGNMIGLLIEGFKEMQVELQEIKSIINKK